MSAADALHGADQGRVHAHHHEDREESLQREDKLPQEHPRVHAAHAHLARQDDVLLRQQGVHKGRVLVPRGHCGGVRVHREAGRVPGDEEADARGPEGEQDRGDHGEPAEGEQAVERAVHEEHDEARGEDQRVHPRPGPTHRRRRHDQPARLPNQRPLSLADRPTHPHQKRRLPPPAVAGTHLVRNHQGGRRKEEEDTTKSTANTKLQTENRRPTPA